jgi:hypothetical protein
MNITAETTDEQINAEVIAARENLAAVAMGSDTGTLTKAVNRIAEQEGRAAARFMMRSALERKASPDQIRAMFMRALTQSVDDTWSGRTNEAKRSQFEGLQREIDDLMWQI